MQPDAGSLRDTAVQVTRVCMCSCQPEGIPGDGGAQAMEPAAWTLAVENPAPACGPMTTFEDFGSPAGTYH